MKNVLALLALIVLLQSSVAQPLVGTRPAPEFPAGLDWINTDRPLTLAELRGKIVVLDFWTYGCINCVHVIPELRELQARFPDELVVIGVHSAKFDNEGTTENILLSSERYGRTEPIVNDNAFEVWQAYGMYAWPGFAIIDPEGMLVGIDAGEGILEPYTEVLSRLVTTFDARGTLDRRPLDFVAGGIVRPRTALSFPGGILVDDGRLYTADSGNNRIVVTDLLGTVLDVAGTGAAGLRDGDFGSATFQRPHGLAAGPDGLIYVADTGNHAIRVLDPEERTVTTVAGTGMQERLFGMTEVDGLVSGLNSPWDVLWHDGSLLVAMAGQHQLWTLDPDSGQLMLFAGSGREELKDGPLQSAGLNQPSGLATDGTDIYVADTEASAIRVVSGDRLETLVGTGLFDFGDRDGAGDEVLLQHATGVVWHDGLLYVADSYNHRIKQLDPETRAVTSVFGSGTAGRQDGAEAQFHEPAALDAVGPLLFIADSNNHAVRVADLESGMVQTLTLRDPDGLLVRRSGLNRFDDVITLDPVAAATGDVQLQVQLTLPEGYVANGLAPLGVSVSAAGEALSVDGAMGSQSIDRPDYPLVLDFPLAADPGTGTIVVEIEMYYCQEEATSLCLIRQVQLRQPVTASEYGSPELAVSYEPPPLSRD